METTLYLAQIWGPVMFAVGLGFFISKNFYSHIYRDLEKETLAVLVFGMAAIAAGIVQVLTHNVWQSFSQIIISLLGWMLLLKGVVLVVFPKMADKAGDWAYKSNIIPFAGIVLLIIGLYLSWIGYFA